jgi:hypothetical protein
MVLIAVANNLTSAYSLTPNTALFCITRCACVPRRKSKDFHAELKKLSRTPATKKGKDFYSDIVEIFLTLIGVGRFS